MQKMRAQHAQMQEFDRSFEKNFKKEFPGLGFNQLEALMKCFKYADSQFQFFSYDSVPGTKMT